METSFSKTVSSPGWPQTQCIMPMHFILIVPASTYPTLELLVWATISSALGSCACWVSTLATELNPKLRILFLNYELCIMEVKWENGLILPKTHNSLKLKCSRLIYNGGFCLCSWTWHGKQISKLWQLETAIWFKGNDVVYWSSVF